MKLFVISFFIFFSFLSPSLNNSNVFATGDLYGHVSMSYQGRTIPLADVYINKTADCNNGAHPKEDCESTACIGKGYCPTPPQTYFTKPDGKYDMNEGGPTLILNHHNNEKRTFCDGDTSSFVHISCGINCGWHAHEFKAFFPPDYDVRNFPGGVDYRKGHFKAVTPKETFGIDTKIYVDPATGDEYYHLNNTNNDNNNPDLDFEWVADPLPVAGVITDSSTGRGINGVGIEVTNDKGLKTNTITDSSGKFSVPSNDLFKNSSRYAVRITSEPAGYKFNTRVVSTTNWSYNVLAFHDQMPPDPSYEQQQTGANDCAGPDNDPSKFPHQVGRCNFKIDPAPLPSAPPSSPVISASPGPSGSGTTNPSSSPSTGGGGGSPSPLPSGTTAECLNMPLNGATVTSISVDNQPVTISGGSALSYTLKGFAGQTNYVVPVVINYSNNACRALSLRFTFNSSLTPRPTPDPVQCAKPTNRPDDCACNANAQCTSGKCDPNRGSVCSTAPFIRTQGGDVHSNTGITQ